MQTPRTDADQAAPRRAGWERTGRRPRTDRARRARCPRRDTGREAGTSVAPVPVSLRLERSRRCVLRPFARAEPRPVRCLTRSETAHPAPFPIPFPIEGVTARGTGSESVPAGWKRGLPDPGTQPGYSAQMPGPDVGFGCRVWIRGTAGRPRRRPPVATAPTRSCATRARWRPGHPPLPH